MKYVEYTRIAAKMLCVHACMLTVREEWNITILSDDTRARAMMDVDDDG